MSGGGGGGQRQLIKVRLGPAEPEALLTAIDNAKDVIHRKYDGVSSVEKVQFADDKRSALLVISVPNSDKDRNPAPLPAASKPKPGVRPVDEHANYGRLDDSLSEDDSDEESEDMESESHDDLSTATSGHHSVQSRPVSRPGSRRTPTGRTTATPSLDNTVSNIRPRSTASRPRSTSSRPESRNTARGSRPTTASSVLSALSERNPDIAAEVWEIGSDQESDSESENVSQGPAFYDGNDVVDQVGTGGRPGSSSSSPLRYVPPGQSEDSSDQHKNVTSTSTVTMLKGPSTSVSTGPTMTRRTKQSATPMQVRPSIGPPAPTTLGNSSNFSPPKRFVPPPAGSSIDPETQRLADDRNLRIRADASKIMYSGPVRVTAGFGPSVTPSVASPFPREKAHESHMRGTTNHIDDVVVDDDASPSPVGRLGGFKLHNDVSCTEHEAQRPIGARAANKTTSVNVDGNDNTTNGGDSNRENGTVRSKGKRIRKRQPVWKRLMAHAKAPSRHGGGKQDDSPIHDPMVFNLTEPQRPGATVKPLPIHIEAFVAQRRSQTAPDRSMMQMDKVVHLSPGEVRDMKVRSTRLASPYLTDTAVHLLKSKAKHDKILRENALGLRRYPSHGPGGNDCDDDDDDDVTAGSNNRLSPLPYGVHGPRPIGRRQGGRGGRSSGAHHSSSDVGDTSQSSVDIDGNNGSVETLFPLPSSTDDRYDCDDDYSDDDWGATDDLDTGSTNDKHMNDLKVEDDHDDMVAQDPDNTIEGHDGGMTWSSVWGSMNSTQNASTSQDGQTTESEATHGAALTNDGSRARPAASSGHRRRFQAQQHSEQPLEQHADLDTQETKSPDGDSSAAHGGHNKNRVTRGTTGNDSDNRQVHHGRDRDSSLVSTGKISGESPQSPLKPVRVVSQQWLCDASSPNKVTVEVARGKQRRREEHRAQVTKFGVGFGSSGRFRETESATSDSVSYYFEAPATLPRTMTAPTYQLEGGGAPKSRWQDKLDAELRCKGEGMYNGIRLPPPEEIDQEVKYTVTYQCSRPRLSPRPSPLRYSPERCHTAASTSRRAPSTRFVATSKSQRFTDSNMDVDRLSRGDVLRSKGRDKQTPGPQYDTRGVSYLGGKLAPPQPITFATSKRTTPQQWLGEGFRTRGGSRGDTNNHDDGPKSWHECDIDRHSGRISKQSTHPSAICFG